LTAPLRSVSSRISSIVRERRDLMVA
jgi:hypothetical protein